MEVVGEASDGYQAIEAFGKFRPDVALIDLQMPGMNGIDTIIAILEKWPGARCVVLTTYAGDVQATRALKAGAKGYLLKSMLRKDLIDTIRTVHSGKSRIPAEIASELASHLTSDALSAREIEVLRMVGEGCSNKVVADHLISLRTRSRVTCAAFFPAERERPHARSNDRRKTWLHRRLTQIARLMTINQSGGF